MFSKYISILFDPENGAGAGGDAGAATNNGTTTTNAPAQPQTGQQTPNYEAMYKALQATHQNVVETARATEARLNADAQLWQQRADQLGQSDSALKGQLSALNENLNAASTSAQQAAAERDAAVQRAERANLLLTEFPDLAPFEAKGLLPTTGTAEELREALTNFKATLSQVGVQAASDAVAGATAPPPATQPTSGQSIDELYDLAMDASKKGDIPKYNEYMKQIMEKATSDTLQPKK